MVIRVTGFGIQGIKNHHNFESQVEREAAKLKGNQPSWKGTTTFSTHRDTKCLSIRKVANSPPIFLRCMPKMMVFQRYILSNIDLLGISKSRGVKIPNKKWSNCEASWNPWCRWGRGYVNPGGGVLFETANFHELQIKTIKRNPWTMYKNLFVTKIFSLKTSIAIENPRFPSFFSTSSKKAHVRNSYGCLPESHSRI